ncbi:MAG: tRNA pseudouridine(55) synthase TruB [Lachnospiraceae bacterium]|nr:tRNA pseudouridine(55) synthase TruB [Lachnospiraceae bacterium]
MVNGIINIYKEAGFTSHDVVAKLRGIVKQRKIGHTGTLDPDATGVLPVCLGNATKLCDMLTDKSKEYEACMLLGVTTDTQDMSGQVMTKKQLTCTEEEAREAVLSFVGGYDQIPPMYSALKVNGKKLYELARKGIEVERQPRRVEIPAIDIIECKLPEIRFRVSCSKGTYIRSLCADIGDKLGCGAAMKSLVRTRVGVFSIEEAWKLSEVEKMVAEGTLLEHITASDQVFIDCPKVVVKPEFDRALANGNKLGVKQVKFEKEQTLKDGELLRVYDSKDIFTGVYTYVATERCLKPYKMFFE